MEAKPRRCRIEQEGVGAVQATRRGGQLPEDLVHHGTDLVGNFRRKNGRPVTGDPDVQGEPRPRRMSFSQHSPQMRRRQPIAYFRSLSDRALRT